ncbi:hypothetical protein [Xanthomonas arboricola]|uniref:hypothetical protein n=1 Tax=Xanthomonas arboricola TaxID=56448 RepID=UPI003EBB8AAD
MMIGSCAVMAANVLVVGNLIQRQTKATGFIDDRAMRQQDSLGQALVEKLGMLLHQGFFLIRQGGQKVRARRDEFAEIRFHSRVLVAKGMRHGFSKAVDRVITRGVCAVYLMESAAGLALHVTHSTQAVLMLLKIAPSNIFGR